MLSIGQMSRACGVSVKTLHHYDRIGLLRPQKIDGDSGYRYYEETQIQTMLLISRLKRYGFSLSDIGTLLEEPGRLGMELDRQRLRLERQAEHLDTVIREVRHHMEMLERTGDIMSYQNPYEVKLETAKEQWLLTQRHKMSVEEFGKYYGMIFEKIARERIETNGVVLAMYHDKEFDPACSEIELGVGVKQRKDATTVLPSRLCATVVHVGPYSGLPDAYGAITTWISANGYQIDGAPYEIYLKDRIDGLPPEEWETKLVFPVKK